MPTLADRFSLPFLPSTFGNRFGTHDIENGHDVYGPQGHRGTDFVVGAGTPVPVIANGVVEHVLHSDALGNVVVVRHYLPGAGNDVYSGYCHLVSSSVRVGQFVARGAIIAKSGATGTACYGAHLHLTMSHDDMGVEYGEVFDPLIFIGTFKTTVATTVATKKTTARRGEGLSTIASRSGITLPKIKQLNPKITAPSYIVHLGQDVRIG